MFKVSRFIFIFLLAIAYSINGNAQQVAPADVVNYLKNKLEIFYVDQPNSTSGFSQNAISPDIISNSADGSFFGNRPNAQMNTSADLLMSLFKNRNSGGDGLLQDVVYLLLKVKDAKLSIHFINDIREPLGTAGVLFTGVDTVTRGGGLRVYPSVYNLLNIQGAGNILLGEYLCHSRLHVAKRLLLNMVTNAAIGSYRLYHEPSVISLTVPRYPNIVFYATNAVMDQRYVSDQAIVNAVYASFTDIGRNELYNWVKRPSLIMLKRLPAGSVEELRNNWLLTQGTFNGLTLAMDPTPSPPVPASISPKYGWINFSAETGHLIPSKRIYKIRNEMTQSLIYEFCLRVGSVRTFLEAVKYNNNSYSAAAPENKMAVLLANFSQVLIGNRTITNLQNSPPVNKNYLAPVALVHYLKGGIAEFTYDDFRNVVGDGFPQELFNLYRGEQRSNVEALGRSVAGEVNWYDARDRLRQILGCPENTH